MPPRTEAASLLSAGERALMIAARPDKQLSQPPKTTSSSSSAGRASEKAKTTANSSSSTATNKPKTKAVEEPAPVKYLHTLFSKSEGGQRIMKRPLSCTFTKPTQEATDAYDINAVRAIREKNITLLRSMLDEGKSLDACNRFGESLIHMACRRGDVEVVRFLILEGHVRVDVRDDFGRTPLHDACWTTMPNFKVMDLLLKTSPPELLLAEDVRGHTPFHYARREHWDGWVDFLKERGDVLTQRISIQVVG